MNSIRSELNSLIVGEFRSRKSSSAGLFSIVGAFFYAALAALLAELLARQFPNDQIIFRAAAVFFIGTRWRALGNMMHECSHGIFVKNPAHNTSFGHLLAALELSSFKEYAQQHLTHHAYLGNPEQDLDFKSRRIFLAYSNRPMHVVLLLVSVLSLVPLWWVMLRPVIWKKGEPFWTHCLRILVLASTLLLLVIPATRQSAFLYILLPFVTTYQWMKITSDLADHLGLYNQNDPLERSRNHLLPTRWLNWLLFPRHDGYHLLHHLFPSLPTQHYPTAHQKLMQNSWYSEKKHFWGIESEKFKQQVSVSHGQSK